MEVVEFIDFTINKKQALSIYLPCRRTQVLPYTKVSIEYVNEEHQLDLDLFVDDYLSAAITAFDGNLRKALNGELDIGDNYKEKGIGYYYNLYYYKASNGSPESYHHFDKFGLWLPNHIGIGTFIYSRQDAIYLEIFPRYKWHGTVEASLLYEKFLQDYHILDIIRIDKELALLWQKECDDILEIIQRNEEQESCIE